jgi:type II secretory pathway predicted ATPase ExeA
MSVAASSELAAGALARVRDAFALDGRDPRLFLPPAGDRDLLERLRQGRAPGTLVVVTGAPGTGKTLLLHALVAALPVTAAAIIVPDPEAARTDTRFLRMLIERAGGTPHGRTGLELTTELLERIAAIGEEGRTATVLIDDAHRLSGSQLEIVRTLLTAAGGRHPLDVVLFGEPEMLDKIARKRRLAERVTLRHELGALSVQDGAALLDHRLASAGLDPEQIFAPGAREAIQALGEGNPGQMLRIARAGAASAVMLGSGRIDTTIIERAARGRIEDPLPREAQLPLFERLDGPGARSGK